MAGVHSNFEFSFYNTFGIGESEAAGRTKHSYRHCLVLLDPATTYANVASHLTWKDDSTRSLGTNRH